MSRRAGSIGPRRLASEGGIWSLNDQQQEAGSNNWGISLVPFSNILTTSLPHSGINTTEAGSTSITSFGTAAMSQSGTSAFGAHDGHEGSPADWPAYLAVYVGGTYGKVACNQLQITVHANSFGNFTLQGSNNADTSGVFYNTGTWTSLPFTYKGSTQNSQNAGGSGSGLSEYQILTFKYDNNLGYSHYRLYITDSNLPSETANTEFAGWASYNWKLSRVPATPTFRYYRYVVGSAIASHHPRVSRIVATLDGVDTDIVYYVSDNCSDSGTVPTGTLTTYDAVTAKAVTAVKIYSSFGAGLRSSNYTLQGSTDNSYWVNVYTGVATNNTSCGLITNTINS